MFFTGYDMTKPKESDYEPGDILGVAFIGSTCLRSGRQTSLVEDEGNFFAAIYGAHELGHSLSAQHDPAFSMCNIGGPFIMFPVAHYVDTFSTCSANDFQSFERVEGNFSTRYQCLHHKSPVINSTDVTQLMLGELYDIDAQCRQRFGSGSHHCNSSNLKGNQTEVTCRNLFCHIPRTTSCSDIQPARGTSCGVGEWCVDQKCVSNGQIQRTEQGETARPTGATVGVVLGALLSIVGIVFFGIFFCRARRRPAGVNSDTKRITYSAIDNPNFDAEETDV
ncbi:A disintegrin and metalloproteinase with thrombospondin motifs like [Littorina saxatilis]|uniref:A disintegrin and metalloproteinase with thrombospondin motifs like n=1 Tax=Littorina saxatilis TaxID=31220 RepID=UPI0038B525AE